MIEDTLILVAVSVAIPYLIASLAIVPYVARARNRTGLGWTVLSLLVTPVLALLALAALPVVRGDRGEMAECPYCAEDVKSDGLVCPHCRSALDSKALGRLTPRKP